MNSETTGILLEAVAMQMTDILWMPYLGYLNLLAFLLLLVLKIEVNLNLCEVAHISYKNLSLDSTSLNT